MPLTDAKARNARPRAKQVKLFDGGGLFLLILPAGGKYWRMKYRFGGKEKTLAFGTYPEVSLSKARERREDARRKIAEGIDPGEARKAQKAAKAASEENSCKDFMEAGKTRLKEANSTEVQELRAENARLRELVCEQALELQLLKKSLN